MKKIVRMVRLCSERAQPLTVSVVNMVMTLANIVLTIFWDAYPDTLSLAVSYASLGVSGWVIYKAVQIRHERRRASNQR